MKKFYLILCLALIIPALNLTAQKPITVYEDSVLVGNYMHPGLSVTIPEVDYQKTLKNWIKQIETSTKSKVISEDGLMTIFGAIVKKISPNPVNIYSRLINQDTLNKLMVCIELKKDQYLEPALGDAQMTTAKDYLKAFARDQYIEFIKDEVTVEEKKLKELNNEMNALENTNSKSQRQAKSGRSTISDKQELLALNNNELAQVTADLNQQRTDLIGMEAGADKDTKAAQVKDLEKRKKKLQKEISNAEKKVKKAESSINQADRAIPLNESEQEAMRAKITQQEAVVQKFKDKLNTVKLY
jgi:predicted  nucleic acid-binding Zn-ribbon protein